GGASGTPPWTPARSAGVNPASLARVTSQLLFDWRAATRYNRKDRLMDRNEAFALYRQMLLIRRFEERCAQLYVEGRIGGFLHLYIGQEAVGVGAMSVMRPDDYLIAYYRDHGYALARGADPRQLLAELCGKLTGISRGKGGSMHFYDVPRGNFG